MSNSPLHSYAANAVHVMQQCDAFSELGYSVTLHAISEPIQNDYFESYRCKHKFKLILKNRGSIKYVSPVLYALRQVLDVGWDKKNKLLYCRCVLSAFFALKAGYNVILEIHEIPTGRLSKFLYQQVIRDKKLLRLVAISSGLKRDLLESFNFGAHELDIVVAHDGARVPEIGESKRMIFAKNDYRKIVGYGGGLRIGNGISLIIELAQANPEALFVLAGGDRDAVSFWKTKVKSSNVIFLGQIPPSEMAGFLFQCDILIAPYRQGPKTQMGNDTSRWMSPLKVFEYMAAGKPVMVSDFSVIREVLNEDSAVLVEPDNFVAWDEQLGRLMDDEEYAQNLGRNAFYLFNKKYTWIERAKAVLCDIYI